MPPHEGRVGPQRLDEAVAAALEGLLQRRLADGARRRAAEIEADRAAERVAHEHAAPVREILAELVRRFSLIERGGARRAVEKSGENALRVRAAEPAGICQRPQQLLGRLKGGDQPVDPAEKELDLRADGKPPRLKIGAAAEGRLERGGAQRRRALPGGRREALFRFFGIIHIVQYSLARQQYAAF